MPMMISGKNMEKYELKTGPGLRVVPFKPFSLKKSGHSRRSAACPGWGK
jgi:hypothetical protein